MPHTCDNNLDRRPNHLYMDLDRRTLGSGHLVQIIRFVDHCAHSHGTLKILSLHVSQIWTLHRKICWVSWLNPVTSIHWDWVGVGYKGRELDLPNDPRRSSKESNNDINIEWDMVSPKNIMHYIISTYNKAESCTPDSIRGPSGRFTLRHKPQRSRQTIFEGDIGTNHYNLFLIG